VIGSMAVAQTANDSNNPNGMNPNTNPSAPSQAATTDAAAQPAPDTGAASQTNSYQNNANGQTMGTEATNGGATSADQYGSNASATSRAGERG
jgi:hypothetical protein